MHGEKMQLFPVIFSHPMLANWSFKEDNFAAA